MRTAPSHLQLITDRYESLFVWTQAHTAHSTTPFGQIRIELGNYFICTNTTVSQLARPGRMSVLCHSLSTVYDGAYIFNLNNFSYFSHIWKYQPFFVFDKRYFLVFDGSCWSLPSSYDHHRQCHAVITLLQLHLLFIRCNKFKAVLYFPGPKHEHSECVCLSIALPHLIFRATDEEQMHSKDARIYRHMMRIRKDICVHRISNQYLIKSSVPTIPLGNRYDTVYDAHVSKANFL